MTAFGPSPAPPFDPGSVAITEVVQRVSRRAETITTALGLPTEEKYAVLAALGPEIVAVVAAPDEDAHAAAASE